MYKTAILLLIFLWCSKTAYAMGAFLTDGSFQVAPTEVKLLVVLDNQKETIYASNTFSFNPLVVWTLGWFIATPAEPTLTVLSDDVFLSVDKWTQKTFDNDRLWKKILFPDIAYEPHLPAQTVSRIAYIKNPVVYPPDPKTLTFSKDYAIPKRAKVLLNHLYDTRHYLIEMPVDSMHIELTATDSLTMSAAHTMPVRITFASQKPVIPMNIMQTEPDRDSARVPLFAYGLDSRDVLGVEDEAFDALVSTQSANVYPNLPLDTSNIKIEITVIAPKKMTVPGFTTIYAAPLPNAFRTIVDLPKQKLMVTKLYRYLPLSQIDDMTLTPDSDKRTVNAAPGTFSALVRVLGILLALFYVKKRYF